MKVVFFETTPQEQKTLKKWLHPALEVKFYTDKLTAQSAAQAKEAAAISVFINSAVDKKIIKALPKLKLIATRSTGFDHIDLKSAQAKNIQVANVPRYGSRTVAEFTFGLILNLSRQIYEAYHQLREAGSFDISQFEGFDLFGKTLGVIGTGKIGRNVIKIAKGFGMKVIAFDVQPDKAFATEYDFQYADLKKLLKTSDIVTLHVPYNKHTHHLINQNNIFDFKPGAYLINTARGGIVETEALLSAIKQGHLAGAGLDVLEGEKALKEELELTLDPKAQAREFKTLVQDHILIDLPQVIVTPHIAFFSHEAKERILKTTAQNINNFLGGQPTNTVN